MLARSRRSDNAFPRDELVVHALQDFIPVTTRVDTLLPSWNRSQSRHRAAGFDIGLFSNVDKVVSMTVRDLYFSDNKVTRWAATQRRNNMLACFNDHAILNEEVACSELDSTRVF